MTTIAILPFCEMFKNQPPIFRHTDCTLSITIKPVCNRMVYFSKIVKGLPGLTKVSDSVFESDLQLSGVDFTFDEWHSFPYRYGTLRSELTERELQKEKRQSGCRQHDGVWNEERTWKTELVQNLFSYKNMRNIVMVICVLHLRALKINFVKAKMFISNFHQNEFIVSSRETFMKNYSTLFSSMIMARTYRVLFPLEEAMQFS